MLNTQIKHIGIMYLSVICYYCILFCRFDLIFLMLDPQSEHYDRKLGKHIVSLYYQSKDKEEDELMVCNSMCYIF